MHARVDACMHGYMHDSATACIHTCIQTLATKGHYVVALWEEVQPAVQGTLQQTVHVHAYLSTCQPVFTDVTSYSSTYSTVDDINPALPIIRNMPSFHSLGS